MLTAIAGKCNEIDRWKVPEQIAKLLWFKLCF